jgi:hypothetical protein
MRARLESPWFSAVDRHEDRPGTLSEFATSIAVWDVALFGTSRSLGLRAIWNPAPFGTPRTSYSAVSLLDLPSEPGPRNDPLALYGRRRHLEGFGGLFDPQASEVA